MKWFVGYRPDPPAEYLEKGTANPVDQPQYEGVIFSDGTVAVRWLTAYRSHSLWASWGDFEAVHGHPEYGTKIKWLEAGPAAGIAAVDLLRRWTEHYFNEDDSTDAAIEGRADALDACAVEARTLLGE